MKKLKFKMPSAMVLLFIILVIVALLTWVVPTSVMVYDEDGNADIVYNAAFDGDGNVIENAGTNPAGIITIVLAMIHGFENAADVNFTILISGSFLAIMNYVGALDAGIGALLKKVSGKKLLAILILVFALMATVYGSWEDLIPYTLVLFPLCVSMGYDTLTGFFVLFLGATIGNMASVVNPFSTGIAISMIGNPNLSLGNGIAMRLVLFVVLYALGTFLILRYAEKIKKDPTKSATYGMNVNTLSSKQDDKEFAVLTGKRKASLVIFFVMVLLVVLGYIPWYSIAAGEQTMYEVVNSPITAISENIPFLGNLLGLSSMTWFADWYFDEFSVVFLIGTILVAVINKMSQDDFVSEFVRGASELMGLCLVISIARGISMIMGDSASGMSITFVYWLRSILSNVPVQLFAIGSVLLFIVAAIFVQSTSGLSGLTMPILGALAMAIFTGTTVGVESGQIILVSAFTVGANFMSCSVYPDAAKMGTLELTNIPYSTYLKEAVKITVPLLIAATLVIVVSPYLGLC